jgi:hypothetical protein
MDTDLAPKAINAALKNNWQQAIEINGIILESDTKNTDALNRLAFAYLQLGNAKKAKIHYQQVTKLDPYNEIAKKNLARISTLKGKASPVPKNDNNVGSNLALFIEEPGKTKCIQLIKIATPTTLSILRPAETIQLIPKKHTVVIENRTNTYLGALPDDIGHKLAKRMKAGNKYEACIKSLDKNSLVVFIREISRTKRFKDQPTFPTTTIQDYYSFVKDTPSLDEEGNEKELDEDTINDEE